MTVSLILRLIVIIAGILLFWRTFVMYAKRRLTDNIALSWAAASVIMVLAGAIPAFAGWSTALATGTYILIFSVAAVGILIVYRICIYLSMLVTRNQELAMQVSILNSEIDSLKGQIDEISGRKKDEKEEDIICD